MVRSMLVRGAFNIKILVYRKEKNMQQEYIFSSPLKGGKAIVKIDSDVITISRPGMMSKMTMGFKGDKTIPIKNITSVQVKFSGFARGYIQFTIAGEVAKKAGIDGQLDENIIYFDGKKYNEGASAIKDYIEKYNSNNSNQNIVLKEDDKYDKLAKLKKLLDDDVISKEEFESEKKKILN